MYNNGNNYFIINTWAKEYLDKYMKAFTGMLLSWQRLDDYLWELLSPYGLCTSKAVKLTKQKGGKIYSGADKRLK